MNTLLHCLYDYTAYIHAQYLYTIVLQYNIQISYPHPSDIISSFSCTWTYASHKNGDALSFRLVVFKQSNYFPCLLMHIKIMYKIIYIYFMQISIKRYRTLCIKQIHLLISKTVCVLFIFQNPFDIIVWKTNIPFIYFHTSNTFY